MKNIKLLITTFTMCAFLLTGCTNTTTDIEDSMEPSIDTTDEMEESSTNDETSDVINVAIEIEDYGTIELELYPDIAPITVANFVKLINEDFYDGLTFHRIISGFMIQGGCPDGNGTGGSSETITGEFATNGIENNLSHVRGTISMARSSSYNSASSQFFIVHQDSTFLDGDYATFGSVTSGMEIVDAICANTPTEDSNGTTLAANQPIIVDIIVK